MAKTPGTKEVELHPDAWQRFERAMAVVVKAPPQHRVKKPGKPEGKPSKKRAKAHKPDDH